ncbi:hypothetical protein [Microcoleus sp. Pol17_C1]|uniref:hypothetical protein n=1 Tax=unclassified Microcoleus TaxID=2642155 RepID=UPI002FD62AC7
MNICNNADGCDQSVSARVRHSASSIFRESDIPPGVKNPCLIAKVLSKRTGVDDNLIGLISRLKPTFAMRPGINSPPDLWVNAKTQECQKLWVSPRVRQSGRSF